MKCKPSLYFAIVAVVLLSLVVLPVLAEDDPVTMWVSRVRLAYNGRSSSSPDRMVAMVHVRDANLTMVEGATVTAEWTTPAGVVVEQTAVSAFQGIATFTLWAGRGEYRICVTDVTKDGWLYNVDLNLETCTGFTLPR